MAVAEYNVYILRCGDGSYYTGIATDVERRIAEHESSPRGPKYLRGRSPLTVVFSETVGDRSIASRLEFHVKQLDRAGKQALINGTAVLPQFESNQVSDAAG
jgi:putative endonuclease